MRDTSTRANAKRTFSRGVEAARESTPQSVSFDTLFQTGERELSVKMNFFIKQDEHAVNSEGIVPGTGFVQRRNVKWHGCEKRGSVL